MPVDGQHETCNGHLMKWLTAAGLSWLEHNHNLVNQMNVFPVPDGDTGTNMVLTMRKAYEQVARRREAHVGIVCKEIADGALMGARGNSGVILSQLWRGFAEIIDDQAVFDARLFAQACQAGVEMAYRGVVEPVEGTILTVAREGTEAIVQRAETESNLLTLMELLVERTQASLQRTPELLPMLKEAGVVDSGGMGLVFIFEGMVRLLRGEGLGHRALFAPDQVDKSQWREALIPEDEHGYGYDVQFLMHGSRMDVTAVREAIDAMGWSTLVVGDERLIKVHVHVHDPGEPLSYAIQQEATIDDIVVENMQEQYEVYVEKRSGQAAGETAATTGVAVITVASGEGIRQLFAQDLQAARVILGGQTMNPSTEDFLAAINSLPNKAIVLLPNNKNIIMAAEQASTLAKDKQVRVVPSRTIPQGINALLEYAGVRDRGQIDEVSEVMQRALGDIITCEVTYATRDVQIDGVTARKGQLIGLVDGGLVVAGDTMREVVRDVLSKARADEHELITLYYGSDQDKVQTEQLVGLLSRDFAEQEFDIVYGGQPLYPYIISVE
jgi:hypothetical protein